MRAPFGGTWRFGRDLLSTSVLAVLFLGALAPSALARDAYVVNRGSNSVSVINTQTNQAIGAPIAVGELPEAIAITPDGKTAYVTNAFGNSVSVIDTQTKQVVGPPITVGAAPDGIAITPDGRFAYVADFFSNSVSVIDTQTNQVVGSPITVGAEPTKIAITPAGKTAYVVNSNAKDLSVIDTQNNQVVGSPIAVGKFPIGIAITPDGKIAYVANSGPNTVSVIDTQTNQVVGSPLKVGEEPGSIAITPNGATAYVVNNESNDVSPINTQTNAVGSPIPVGAAPIGIAITPDAGTAYVSETGLSAISPINTQTSQLGSPIGVGTSPFGIAIPPDQPPRASFAISGAPAVRARPGVPLAFNAAASSDPDGKIVSYAWSFGEGQTASGGPTLTHTYGAPGTYAATLSVNDGEGCPGFLFTGQTAYCNGASAASSTQTVTVAYPGVRLECPKRAKPGGCKFKLQVVAKKPKRGRKGKRASKPKVESALARANLRGGRSAIVSLKPKPKFAAGLAAASKILVEETRWIHGVSKTSFKGLSIVQ